VPRKEVEDVKLEVIENDVFSG
jgi:ATP-dependent RNA helicase DDX31/DBP7